MINGSKEAKGKMKPMRFGIGPASIVADK